MTGITWLTIAIILLCIKIIINNNKISRLEENIEYLMEKHIAVLKRLIKIEKENK